MLVKLGRAPNAMAPHNAETMGRIADAFALVGHLPLEYVKGLAFGHKPGNHKQCATWSDKRRGDSFVKYAMRDRNAWIVKV